jgi:hypothetical protein
MQKILHFDGLDLKYFVFDRLAQNLLSSTVLNVKSFVLHFSDAKSLGFYELHPSLTLSLLINFIPPQLYPLSTLSLSINFIPLSTASLYQLHPMLKITIT